MKKCNKCGVEYHNDTKFCSQCGGNLVDVKQVQTHKIYCKNCNGTMSLEDDHSVLVCPFCGSKELIVESDEVTIERIKQKTHKDIEIGKQQIERERMQHEIRLVEEQKKADDIQKFKKSSFGIMLIVFTVISAFMCVISFDNGRALSAILALVMGVLFVSSYLMGIQVIKEKFKGMKIIAAIVAFALIFAYFPSYNTGSSSYKEKPQKFEWSVLEMHEHIPEPPSNYGVIGLDYEDYLSVDIYKISYAEYKEYRNKCIDSGYDKDTSGGGNTYYANNNVGFDLSLYYYENEEKLSILLNAPNEDIESTLAEKTEPTTVIPTEEKTEKPAEVSIEASTERKSSFEYEKAFMRDLSDYNLYYMFDVDKKEVIYFGTNDTYIQKGIYSGDFSTGVDINWINDGWHEFFICENGSDEATLTDGNGWEWEYKVCEVEKAQELLDSIRSND